MPGRGPDGDRREPPLSPLFTDRAGDIREAARLGPVLDLACGRGRHAVAAARMGLPVVAIDRNGQALRQIQRRARAERLALDCVESDLETRYGIPFTPNSCGVILVFYFLFRPLATAIEEALAPGGLLLYETFTIDQTSFATGPRNPAFLLEDGELTTLFPRLRVLAHGETVELSPSPRATARLAARKPER